MQVRRDQHGLLRSILVEQAYQVLRFLGRAPSHHDFFAFHELCDGGLAEIELSPGFTRKRHDDVRRFIMLVRVIKVLANSPANKLLFIVMVGLICLHRMIYCTRFSGGSFQVPSKASAFGQ